ncbi:lipoyl(octanoyl) transferase [Exophiala spinifera]|uniref:Lipoyl(Octanoyl) transferase n=1 Tax=Exophiala spinifera TaxID=91928 RepID=A0A0D1YDH4_9EURO|nr:lipoyl(octanoyl) transferase [Exophiala spinifera]KIW13006.1 lipoyl(octanoyl) transferase [Exophiala spinifera]
MRLAHLHIRRLIPYSHSLTLQNAILERHFTYKDAVRGLNDAPPPGENVACRATGDGGVSTSPSAKASSSPASMSAPLPRTASASRNAHAYKDSVPQSSNSVSIPSFSSTLPPPDPTLLTFSTDPTYTVGRRHLLANPISQSQQNFLTADGLATFHASPRGGLLTYHAPGQLTGYLIADLRRHGITARCWVKMLEDSVMRTCGHWDVQTMRTDDPGVWIRNERELDGQDPQADESPVDRKICAIGVQVSRGVTSHGVGLNVFDAAFPQFVKDGYGFTPEQIRSPSYDPRSEGYLSWGFSRIVACGLEGKSVTWFAREGPEDSPQPPALEDVADVLAREVMRGFNDMKGPQKEAVKGVYRIEESDILAS